MHRPEAFVKKTRRGQVVRVLREQYVRSDIGCGSHACTPCTSLGTSPPRLSSAGRPATLIFAFPHYLVPDTNLLLHQMDVLEHVAVSDVVLLQTVLEEARHRSPTVYDRARALAADTRRGFYVFNNEFHKDTRVTRNDGESPNDRNDRAIRVATAFLDRHYANFGLRAVLLSDDRDSRAIADKANQPCASLRAYVESLSSAPADLADRLAVVDAESIRDAPNVADARVYACEHMEAAAAQAAGKQGTLYLGSFHRSVLDANEAAVWVRGLDDPVIVYGIANMNRAVQDDTVAVRLLPKDKWRAPSNAVVSTESASDISGAPIDPASLKPTGIVVAIVRRRPRLYCGSVDVSEDDFVLSSARTAVGLAATSKKRPADKSLDKKKGKVTESEARWATFVPLDQRFPPIRFLTRQWEQLKDQRIAVALDAWPEDAVLPRGHLVRRLGPIGQVETETQVILIDKDIPHAPFTDQVNACLPDESWNAAEEFAKERESARREDLRHLDVCSVDPPGCTDIDDALHARRIEGGLWEVGVHIADVTHFVRPLTPIDKEAAFRGTTTYLVDRRIDMLPHLLVWTMNDDAQVVSTRFCKSVIRSRHSFTYDQAQERLDAPSKFTDAVSQSLQQLNRFAKILKKRRIDAGALVLASPEVRFQLERDTSDPMEVEMKEMKEANSMVEEFMLLANVSVAEKIYDFFQQCAMLRSHVKPPPARFEAFIQAMASRGFTVAAGTSKELADSLDGAVMPDQPFFNKLARMLATRCMMPAEYFCSGMVPYSEFFHYGLAMPIYTHFTSPIRRYPDVIVHRLLAAALGVEATYPELVDRDAVDRLCDHLNFRHKMAQQAGRASVDMFTVRHFQGKEIDNEEAFVVRVMSNGVLLHIPRFGVDGVADIDPSKVSYDPAANELTRRDKDSSIPARLRLFDRVTVSIRVVQDPVTRRSRVRYQLDGTHK